MQRKSPVSQQKGVCLLSFRSQSKKLQAQHQQITARIIIMPVQLLPFQKLVDIPDVAQRHRSAIRKLAITSIVLIWTILSLFVTSMIVSGASRFYTSLLLFLTTGIPLMVILLVLVSISSGIALCNTDKWASADSCCNLMRSRRAAHCTRSCTGSKHCCARLSNAHIGASVLTGLVLVLYLVALFSDCSQAADHRADYEYYTRTSSEPESRPRSNYYDGRYDTTTRRYRHYRHYYHGSTSCGAAAGFEIPAIILLISLVATTARSAYLLRQIEQSMPEVAVLPPGKMVTQYDQLVPFVPHPIDTGNDEQSASTDGTIVLSTPV
jgi:hypothetical protein